MVERYVPDRGDLIWLSFSPQSGHEQAGRRPALVISPSSYNRRAGLALLCPITRKQKDYPFEVPLPMGGQIEGVILADQVRSLDWHTRDARFIERLREPTVNEVLVRIQALVK